MKRSSLYGAAFILMAAAYTACQSPAGSGNNTNTDSTASAAPAPLQVEPVTGSPTFPDASLKIDKITAEKSGDSAKVNFTFKVANYELTQQTADASTKECSNSSQGQHIHFIMDNQPYAALYKPEHSTTLPLNTEHYLLCFLSRSYHESLKTPAAAVLVHFKVDGNGKIVKLPQPTTPMIFYSRPKGEYVGNDTKNVLLDFYVYGGTLGDSLQVKAGVNDTTFNIRQWQPYFIKNAPMGDLKVTLQLTDGNGNPLQGPNTQVERTAHLAAGEPITQ